jgi:iron complex outermembrane recepter protein
MTFAAGAGAAEQHDLLDLSLETLMQMDVQVTSVSKKETRLRDAATAIAVITPDDIRRLGITSIAEALRLVPGIDVARINANKWAITARGFNGEYASKLLVLVDGRSVYTPNFAGVYWDDQDLVLEDLARIEVIRGPGATLWGANAVNGVINIITKSSRDTHGLLVSAAHGSEEQPSAAVRYGGQASDALNYRIYARYFDRDHFEDSNRQDTFDSWRSLRSGFRLDWQARDADQLTLQGDIYRSDVGQYWTIALLDPPANVNIEQMRDHRGGNLLGRWTREYSATSSSSLQIYYDHLRHIDTGSVETRDTGDVDWQHRFSLGANNVTWGLGYRVSSDEIPPLASYFYDPRSKTTSLYSAFAQDEFNLARDQLQLTFGAKLEHNDYTGFEVQPNARAFLKLGEKGGIWASVARAVRTPARFDHDARVNAELLSEDPLVLLAFINNRSIRSETVVAYELGYRTQFTPSLSLDIATFYNVYDHVLSFDEVEPFFEPDPSPGHLVVPLLALNSVTGNTYGAELTVQWTPMERWKLSGSYSLLRMRTHPESVYVSPGDSPQQQLNLTSYLNVTPRLDLNTAVFYVDGLPRQAVPDYVRWDVGATWRASAHLEFGLWGQNLLAPRHVEFTSISTSIRTEIPRTIVGRVTWSF